MPELFEKGIAEGFVQHLNPDGLDSPFNQPLKYFSESGGTAPTHRLLPGYLLLANPDFLCEMDAVAVVPQ
jgi:hypothetical protein